MARAAGRIPENAYSEAAGTKRLREAVAAHLHATRGLRVAVEDILITAGALDALSHLGRTLLRHGDTAAMEDPGYPVARLALADAGTCVIPIPVDDDGLVVAALPEGRHAPKLVYVTPSHQYPLGARLSLARRLALLAWADRNKAVIIEDDYDSEFRYHAAPLPPLASLSGASRVAYMGTFSKVLSPSLRLGYLVADPETVTRATEWRAARDNYIPAVTQLALSEIIQDGTLSRHIAKMNRLYAERRALLQLELKPVHHMAQLTGLAAGLHVCLQLGDADQAEHLCAEMRLRGFELFPVAAYSSGDGPIPRGVVIGYGALEVDAIIECCRHIREVLLGNGKITTEKM